MKKRKIFRLVMISNFECLKQRFPIKICLTKLSRYLYGPEKELKHIEIKEHGTQGPLDSGSEIIRGSQDLNSSRVAEIRRSPGTVTVKHILRGHDT